MNPGRRVTLDSSVLIAYVVSKKDDSVVKKVVMKSMTDDSLMITDVIMDEVFAFSEKKQSTVTREHIERAISGLNVPIVKIRPIPDEHDLQARYGIRDLSDAKILYSVETTESVILVTYDDDYFDGNVKGLNLEIMDPTVYLYEDDVKSGRYIPKRERNRRYFRSKRRDERWESLKPRPSYR